MNFNGIIIGIVTFLLIGLFHPIVIKGEYYFGTKCWWVFLVVGVLTLLASLFINNQMLAIISAIFGISCLWSIKELFEQEQRVKKGWYPKREKK